MTDETVIVSVKPCVYVLHFTQAYLHAKHYIGMTTLPIADRLARHRTARGAALLRRLLASGGDFILADTWECATPEEARTLEKSLKRSGGASRCCSICKPGNGRGSGRGRNRYGMTPKDQAA